MLHETNAQLSILLAERICRVAVRYARNPQKNKLDAQLLVSGYLAQSSIGASFRYTACGSLTMLGLHTQY